MYAFLQQHQSMKISKNILKMYTYVHVQCGMSSDPMYISSEDNDLHQRPGIEEWHS